MKACKVAPSEMQKMRVCYEISKEFPETIEITVTERPITEGEASKMQQSDATAKQKMTDGLVTFQRIPEHLVGKGKGEALLKWQLKFLRRTTEAKDCTCNAFLPSAYLDLAISNDQKRILNPTQRDFTIREIMKDAGGLGATKKLAKRKMDAYGYVQSECYEVTGSKRMKSQLSAQRLATSLAEVNHAAQADQATKQAVDDDELLPLAAKAMAKLFLHNMNWAKLCVKEMRSIALKYFNIRIDKSDKKVSIINALEQAYEQAQANTRAQFDETYSAAKP